MMGAIRLVPWRCFLWTSLSVNDVLGAAVEKRLEVVHCGLHEARPSGPRGPGDVGRDADVLRREQRVILGRGLLREDIERGAGDLAVVERVRECVGIDQWAAARVDEECRILHLGEASGVDEVLIVRG